MSFLSIFKQARRIPGARSICSQKQNQIRWSGRVGRSILRFCRCSVWPRTVGAVLQRICSVSRSVGADRTGADIWSSIYQTRWLRSSKARFVKFCSASSFASILVRRNLLNFSRALVVSPTKRQCADLSSAVATWSSSPNLIIVVRQSQGYFVRFTCLSRSLFPIRFGAFVQLLSSFGRCDEEESGEKVRWLVEGSRHMEFRRPCPHACQTKSDNLHVVSAFSFAALGQRSFGERQPRKNHCVRTNSLTQTVWRLFFSRRDRSHQSWRNLVDHQIQSWYRGTVLQRFLDGIGHSL